MILRPFRKAINSATPADGRSIYDGKPRLVQVELVGSDGSSALVDHSLVDLLANIYTNTFLRRNTYIRMAANARLGRRSSLRRGDVLGLTSAPFLREPLSVIPQDVFSDAFGPPPTRLMRPSAAPTVCAV